MILNYYFLSLDQNIYLLASTHSNALVVQGEGGAGVGTSSACW